MNPFAVPPLITGIILACIGLFVFFNNKNSRVNIIFTLFCFSMVWWLFGYTIMYVSSNPAVALTCARIGFIGIIFIPLFAYHFIVTFLNIKVSRIFLLGLYSLSIPSIILSRTNYIYSGMATHFWGFYPTAGKYYILFLLMFAVLFLYGVWLLFKNLNRADFSGLKQHQTKYVFLAFGIGMFGIVDYLVKYPFINIYPFGYICALLFISLIAYAIIRHHLMDIEVVIKKTLVFAGLSAFVLGCITITTFAIQDVFGKFIGLPKVLSYVIVSVILITLYEPLKKFLVNITNKYLFQKKYDYRQVLRTFIDNIVTLLNLDKIVTGTLELLDKTLHPQHSAILLLSSSKDKYISHGVKNKSNAQSIGSDSAISAYLKTVKDVLSVENENDKEINENTKNEMLDLKAILAVPIILRNDLIGIMLLGKKKSDEYYTTDDISVLLDLAKAEAIAISNSITHTLLLETQKKEEQSKRLVSMGYLVTNLSHEMRNPINNMSTAVQASLDVIEMELNDITDPKHQKTLSYLMTKLNEAVEKADKATAVFNSILNLMKIDKRKFMPVDIKKIIDEDISRVQPYIKDTDIKVVNLIPQDFPKFKADEITLEQVFFNVINNAIQAIDLSRKGDSVKIRAIDEGDKVRIEVKDNSCGIPKQDIERIFEPFYTTKDKASGYTMGKSKGIGLGLMITHHIINAHNGTIFVESEEGKGTTFIVEIPKETE